jgi:hypothetical protein
MIKMCLLLVTTVSCWFSCQPYPKLLGTVVSAIVKIVFYFTTYQHALQQCEDYVFFYIEGSDVFMVLISWFL